MNDSLARIKNLTPVEQLFALADLLEELAPEFRRTAVEVKAEQIVLAETRERRERPRDA